MQAREEEPQICSPYHILDAGQLRYRVAHLISGEVVTARLSWTDAVFVADSLNRGVTSPALPHLMADGRAA